MPRPTAAQFSYGSATVVFSALALLLLFRTESGIGVAVVGTVALLLGLLVALALPARTRTARPATAPSAARTHRTIEDIEIAAAQREHIGEHSLHR
ncbi:hypothetical protein PV394_35755 [Streptomyces sp. NE06-03E]|uniref:Uncharacterized protein n=2 Tax=Streptomyces TaxID=1883 RepID=A0A652KK61_9ACTN|nr:MULTISPECIES: hypothetical protein [unclassified Streptomyces]WSS62159.1 hypothetical protein OG284_13400 [Streptomyces sp. NBC_01177]WSS69182.1 hypothetical protein OG491_13150 [Streptomyces sp. NBC_01175]WSS76199.1 hypothetical protein OG414_13520 [Streptomyces sp. NBC_01174]MDX3060432.1 hypothetical protein [Streptomyces sp. NE06-03E]MDX3329805.1 hypothetical protein [Streptomyces sp. ME02-6979-3A]